MKKYLAVMAVIACSLGGSAAHAQFNPSNGFSTINTPCGTYFLQGSTYYNWQGVSVGSSLPVCGGAMSLQNSASVLITGGAISGVTVTPKSYTVATLPTCNTAAKGQLQVVTDATTPTYGGALTGGSNVVALALCTGAAWLSH